MYLSQDGFERDNPDLKCIERKPWNVREGDIILLSDSTRIALGTIYIPVVITITDKYADFYREWWKASMPTSRTSYRFYHKALKEEDQKLLYNWWDTTWNSLDTVEIYRKTDKGGQK